MDIQLLESKYNIKVLYLTKVGSHLYGVANENSDVDYSGIFIQNKNTILCGHGLDFLDRSTNKAAIKNTSEDIDFTLKSIQSFGKQLKDGETNALDLMFSIFDDSSTVLIDKNFKSYIERNYLNLISKQSQAFMGYCRKQANKYTLKKDRYLELKKAIDIVETILSKNECSNEKLIQRWDLLKKIINSNKFKYIDFVIAPGPRTTQDIEYLEILNRKFSPDIKFGELISRLNKLESKYGNRARDVATPVEWKSLYTSVRVILEIEELIRDKFITFPSKNKEYISKVKNQQIDEKEVREFLDNKVTEVEELIKSSDLPSETSQLAINDMILNLYN